MVVFTSDDEAGKLRSLCAKLIHEAFPHHTPAERKELRIPGDHDEKWGSIRFRMTMNPYYGRPKVTDKDDNAVVDELLDFSVVCVGGLARVYRDFGGGVMLTVTHVLSQGMTATPFEAPPPKPGQSFMEYLAENHRREQ